MMQLFGLGSLLAFTIGLVFTSIEMLFWPHHHRKKELRFLGEHRIVSHVDQINFGLAFLSVILLIVHLLFEPIQDYLIPHYTILPLFIVALLLPFNTRVSSILLKKAQQKKQEDYFLTAIARLVLAVLLFIPLIVSAVSL